jgi:hypothetical protein
MDPEEEFIGNAITMLHYARTELKQFTAWTNPTTAHGQQAAELLAQLDQLAVGIKQLLQTYRRR